MQIWLSSPITGPKRYDWNGKEWFYTRDSQSIQNLLAKELTELLNKQITIKAD